MSSLVESLDLSILNEKSHCNHNDPPTCIEDKIMIEDVNKNVYPINFVRSGKGPNAVILMPGVMGFAEYAFQPQLDGLPKLLVNYTIVAWDPPGYGKSRPPERKFCAGYYHRDAYIANVLMKKLGFEKYSIVGWCDGGTTGLLMASHYPKAVDKLAIFGATTYISPDDSDFFESTRDISIWPPIMLAQMVDTYGFDKVKYIWELWLDNIKFSCTSDGDKVTKKELQSISAPTLILHGAKDPFLSGDHIPYLREAIKSAEYYEFGDASHSLHLQRPDEFNMVVSEFLQRHTH